MIPVLERSTRVRVSRHALARWQERIDPAGGIADILEALMHVQPARGRLRRFALKVHLQPGSYLALVNKERGVVFLIHERPSPRLDRFTLVTLLSMAECLAKEKEHKRSHSHARRCSKTRRGRGDQGTGGRTQGSGDRRQESGDRRQESGIPAS